MDADQILIPSFERLSLESLIDHRTGVRYSSQLDNTAENGDSKKKCYLLSTPRNWSLLFIKILIIN